VNPIKLAITRIIAEQAEIDTASLDDHQPFSTAGVDSLEMLEIVTAVEDAFDVRFEEAVLDNMNTLADLVQAVEDALQARQSAA